MMSIALLTSLWSLRRVLSLFKVVTLETGHLVMSPELDKIIQAKE
jgi:hypothetical protein